MHDYSDFVKIIKAAAVDAVNSSKPMIITYGTVTNANPLEIYIEPKLTLSENQLVLTRNVTDYDVEMTVNHNTENEAGGSGDDSFANHNHAYTGKKIFKVHNSLRKDEKVLLAREPGGQRFIVLDRIGEL